MNRNGMGVLAVLVLGMTSTALAADGGSGHFRIGEQRLDVEHAIAVVSDEGHGDAGPRTFVYLSDVPLDAARAAAAFDPEDVVREQLAPGDHGYVRLCIDADGSECGLFFSPEGFNTGGYGTLALTTHGAARIAGRWQLLEPETFFDKSYDFDLRFDVAVTPPPGKDLPANGGDPGKAYRAYIAALAKGDLPALRRLTDPERGYRYPEDDDARAKESLKSARDGEPVSAEILRGRIDGDDAVLWIEGVDRDDIRRSGRVRMQKLAGGWRFVESDLESID